MPGLSWDAAGVPARSGFADARSKIPKPDPRRRGAPARNLPDDTRARAGAAAGAGRGNPLSLAVGALARRRLGRGERIDRRRAALLEVLVGLRFLLFLVAA